jgi:hypothetical protein
MNEKRGKKRRLDHGGESRLMIEEGLVTIRKNDGWRIKSDLIGLF